MQHGYIMQVPSSKWVLASEYADDENFLLQQRKDKCSGEGSEDLLNE